MLPASVDLTLVVAAWGAILSSLLAVLKVADFRRDRPRLKVEAIFGAEVPGGAYAPHQGTWRDRLCRPRRTRALERESELKLEALISEGAAPVLLVAVMNMGRRATTVESVAPELQSGENILSGDPFRKGSQRTPNRLDEGERFQAVLDAKGLMDVLGERGDEIIGIRCEEQAGRVTRRRLDSVVRRRLRALEESVRRASAQ